MKKIFVMLGIVFFFTCTALCISFTNWTWIDETSQEANFDICSSKNGSLVTQEKRMWNGILQFRSMCICNPGLKYDVFQDHCLPIK